MKTDNVNHPSHYNQGDIECIDAVQAAVTGKDGMAGFLTGNVIKYLWRYEAKGKPVEDLKKAEWYLQRLLKYEESKNTSKETPPVGYTTTISV